MRDKGHCLTLHLPPPRLRVHGSLPQRGIPVRPRPLHRSWQRPADDPSCQDRPDRFLDTARTGGFASSAGAVQSQAMTPPVFLCSGVSRRASSIFFCASISPSALGRCEAFRPGTEDVDFIAQSYMETTSRHYSGGPACDPSYSHLPTPTFSRALLRIGCDTRIKWRAVSGALLGRARKPSNRSPWCRCNLFRRRRRGRCNTILVH